MEEPIAITKLNDFIFCPASIYFHGLFGSYSEVMYQSQKQLDGKEAHKTIDTGGYSTSKDILQGIPVFSEQYGLYGKIDLYDRKTLTLTERKKKIVKIYDGYVFQLFGQYFGMTEIGYTVEHMELYSMDDNKKYPIDIPAPGNPYYNRFLDLIEDISCFELSGFVQTNIEKCRNCIYSNLCDRTLMDT